MHPGERVDVINRVAERLGAKADWRQIDLILDQFGCNTYDEWDGDEVAYVTECIQHADTDKLVGLDRYLRAGAPRAEGPWRQDYCRVFLTHIARQKDVAAEIKSCLEYYGVDAFVAHADIEPGKEWRAKMKTALESCDALVGLLHEGFRESDWCDQEVGIAVGRGIPVVPIQYDFPPYGFFGELQAVNASSGQEPAVLARSLVRILLKEVATATRLKDAIVHRLEQADTFKQANELSGILATEAPLPSRDQVTSLRLAEQENSQLEHAWNFDRHLSSIEARIPGIQQGSARHAFAEAEPF